MSMFAGEKVKTRCPACRSADFLLTEVVEECVFYKVVDGVMPESAIEHQPGSPLYLSARCAKCDNIWRPRGQSLTDAMAD